MTTTPDDELGAVDGMPLDEELAADAPLDEELAGDEPVEDEPVEDEPDAEPSSTAIIAALEREHTRHAKALAKALGVEVEDMHLCPTCEGVGFTPERVEPEPGLQRDPFTETCERCAGYGAVLTGARAPGLTEIPCPGCGGQGYVQRVEQPEAGVAPSNGPAYAPPAPSGPMIAPGDAAAVEDLRARGYMVVEPIEVPAPAAT